MGTDLEARLSKRTHGKVGTYSYGCRCDLCRESWTAWVATNVRQRAHALARRRAAVWVRINHPDVWELLIDEAASDIRKRDQG